MFIKIRLQAYNIFYLLQIICIVTSYFFYLPNSKHLKFLLIFVYFPMDFFIIQRP